VGVGVTERSTAEILRAARKRICRSSRWTQGWFARERQRGKTCSATDPKARCWCAVGALQAELGVRRALVIAPGDFGEAGRFLMAASEGLSDNRFPEGLNDRGQRSVAHRKVLALYDRAIELAEASS
jgi:hypothetical protein